jgi:hypothetical protein
MLQSGGTNYYYYYYHYYYYHYHYYYCSFRSLLCLVSALSIRFCIPRVQTHGKGFVVEAGAVE